MRKKDIPTFSFSSILIDWYQGNKRNLPWRLTNNPYFIWLSEVILQQTRVDQGIPYYLKFVENYPQIEMLASASEDEVLKLWQGLGYYSRARNLHYAARYIVEHHNGVFPNVYKDVLSLKGVGEYTAAAVVSFAYNMPYAAVDGNAYRVLSRIFGVEEYIDTSAGKKIFQDLATSLLDSEQAGLYNQAIMEFGSMQCVPSSPNCEICPFVQSCVAYNNDTVRFLPKKRGKVVVRNRYFHYFDVRVGDSLFLRRREKNDIWKGLYEFPLIETEKEMSFDELCGTEEYKEIFKESAEIVVQGNVYFKHILSHQRIHARFYRVNTDVFLSNHYFEIDAESVDDYAVPRLIDKYIEK